MRSLSEAGSLTCLSWVTIFSYRDADAEADAQPWIRGVWVSPRQNNDK